MPNTRKVELSLQDVDTLELALTRFMGEVQASRNPDAVKRVETYPLDELENLRQRLLAVGDDIWTAHKKANNR